MNPSLSNFPLQRKKSFLIPLPVLIWQLPFRLPHLIDGINTFRTKEQKSNLGHPLPKLAGTRLHAGPGLQSLPNTCPGQAGTRAWYHHSRSEGYASIKRLGTPGLTCIRYHTEHPEIISPLHNPVTWHRRGEDLVHHIHSEENTKGDDKIFTLVTFAKCDCDLGAYF